ncbi:hypothetical protein BX616_004806, partial [Lobosporangium transversale]
RVFDPDPTLDQSEVNISSLTGTLKLVPLVFLTETHLATVQSILSYANVPCPLPTRLWARFNVILDLLWDEVAKLFALFLSSSSSGAVAAILDQNDPICIFFKLYCPAQLWSTLITKPKEASLNMVGSEGPMFRLSNTKLVQLLMTWTVRQGPLCSDIGHLEKLQQFCVARLDTKISKGLNVKLDTTLLKRRSS